MLMSLDVPMGTSSFLYPTNVKMRASAVGATFNLNVPSAPVCVPEVVPLICTDTPGKGPLPNESVTLPVIVLVCENASTDSKSIHVMCRHTRERKINPLC